MGGRGTILVMSVAIAAALKPLALLAICTGLAAVRYAVMRLMPESKLKRLLLKDV